MTLSPYKIPYNRFSLNVKLNASGSFSIGQFVNFGVCGPNSGDEGNGGRGVGGSRYTPDNSVIL